MGTATTFLALALARARSLGRDLLGKHAAALDRPALGRASTADAGIRIRPVPERRTRGALAVRQAHSVALGLRDDPPDVVDRTRLRRSGVLGAASPAGGHRRSRTRCSSSSATARDATSSTSRRSVASAICAPCSASASLEQAAVELADVVVSPSAYLVDWMRDQGWELPERTLVIPYFTRPARPATPAATPTRRSPTRFGDSRSSAASTRRRG